MSGNEHKVEVHSTSGAVHQKIAEYVDVAATLILSGGLITLFRETTVGGVIGGVGVLLLAHRYIMANKLKETIAPIETTISYLSQVMDLSRRSNVDGLTKLVNSYLRISEDEFRFVKENIIADAVGKLERIAHEKVSEELSRGEYYQWLLPMLNEVPAGGMIRAISLMYEAEWDDSAEEERFFQGNINAARRGVTVERIFVMPADKIEKALTLEPIKAHSIDGDGKLHGYVVDANKLQKNDPGLFKDIGSGFLDLNGRVALIDSFSPTGEVRGYVTMKPSELRRISVLFERLKNMSSKLNINTV